MIPNDSDRARRDLERVASGPSVEAIGSRSAFVALGSESASDPSGNSCSEVTCFPLDVLSSRMVFGFVKALLAILLSTLGG